jgi:predicted phosphoadenosine phosphosulfate sulfurtransferase
MNLDWHCRLIARMVKNNIDATIKDYFSIVDKEEENESFETVRIVEPNASVEIKNLAIYGVIERDEFVKSIEREKVVKKRKRYLTLKRNWIV